MALQEEFEATGNWLFSRRGYLPVMLLALLVLVVHEVPRPFVALADDEPWELACAFVTLVGAAIRAFTVGCAPRRTSGRNTHRQIADALNTTGMYSIVRHPLYFGNLVIVIGLASFAQLWWLTLLAICVFVLYYERIMFAEEAFLRRNFGAAYEEWSQQTPAWIPRLSRWTAPALPFSLRNVLRREYNGAFAIVLVFTLLDLDEGLSFTQQLEADVVWVYALPIAACTWLLLRSLKRYTRLLDVPGR